MLAGCPAVQTVASSAGNAGLAGVSAGSGGTGSGSAGSGGTTTTGTATLSWTAPTTNTDGSILNDLAGYHIHYGTSASALTQTIDVSGGGTTSYVVTGLPSGYTYYFSISAYSSAGTESANTSVVSKTI